MHPFKRTRQRRRALLRLTGGLAAVAVAAVALSAAGGTAGQAGAGTRVTVDTGPSEGMLPRSKLTLGSAINVDLREKTVRLPLYEGDVGGTTVWFVLLDASDEGLADNHGVNFAPKLANLAINCPACVQTVTIDNPSHRDNPFGPAVVHFAGKPDFSPKRVAAPGPKGFPLKEFQPGAVAGPGYTPFIRIEGSPVVYAAPIVAVGDGPFDVKTHTNTSDRALGIHIAPESPPGQFRESWVDMLFVRGFDAGEPIVYLSTEAGDPLAATLERATFVPALAKAAYAGGDDFLGSARERLFGFINGQTGNRNPESQGFVHLALDGHISEDASSDNRELIRALRTGGDLLRSSVTSRRWKTRATRTPTACSGTLSSACGRTRQ
jgi:hypothetical protein